MSETPPAGGKRNRVPKEASSDMRGGAVADQDAVLQGRGFFASLFDISFRSFITLRFIRVLYVILIVVVALGSLGVLASVASGVGGFGGFVVGLILALVFGLFYLIVFRLLLELIVVIFRIGENTSILVEQSRSGGNEETTAPQSPAGP